jgi:hypothetical protein
MNICVDKLTFQPIESWNFNIVNILTVDGRQNYFWFKVDIVTVNMLGVNMSGINKNT